MNRDKVIEILEEKLSAIDSRAFMATIDGIPEAADAIMEAMAVKWYYPEKDQYPEDEQRIWFCLQQADRPIAGDYCLDDTDIRYPVHIFASDRGDEYYDNRVRCWTPFIYPTPPQ